MQKIDVANERIVVSRKPHWGVLCLLGLGVSLATWGLTQWKYPFVTVSEEFSIGMGASNQARAALLAEQARANRLNAAVVLGMAGALLAGGLAIFAWPCCGPGVRLVTATVGGGVWGASTGFVGTSLYSLVMPTDSLPGPTHIGLAQSLVWALFGVGMGLLFAMFSRKKPQLLTAAVSGVAAGAFGGVLYPVVASLVLPSQGTTEFIAPGSSVRMVWLSLPLVAIAVAVPRMCANKQQSPLTSPEN